MSWIAEYDTQGREFPTCVHVTKTTGTMTHGVTYVPIEDGKAVRAENAKLRELVRDYDKVLDDAVYVWGTVADFLGYGRKYDALHDRMMELGIEVGA